MPIVVHCTCGKSFHAPDSWAGKQTSCPNCSAALAIPAANAITPGLTPLPSEPADPLGLPNMGPIESHYAPLADPYAAQSGYTPQGPAAGYGWQGQPVYQSQPVYLAPVQKGDSDGSRAMILGIVGVVALGIFAVGIITAVHLFRSNNTVAQANPDDAAPPSPAPAPAPVDNFPPDEFGGSNLNPAETDGSQPDLFSDDDPPTYGPVESPQPPTPEPEPEPEPELQPAAPLTFADGLPQWQATNRGTLKGATPVQDEKLVVMHHSWQTQLLPYLEQSELFNKFNFQKPWTENPNLELAHTVVPQFLNPADDRQRWVGYPYNGVALTHFVGMSGVEDKRNVVAAALPRSDNRAGVFGYDRVAAPEEITDGLSQTVMILGSGELAGPWAQGGGATIRGAREPYFDSLTGFGSRGVAQGGTLSVFADGSVRQISSNVSPSVFRAMCTIHGADRVDQTQLGRQLENLPSAE